MKYANILLFHRLISQVENHCDITPDLFTKTLDAIVSRSGRLKTVEQIGRSTEPFTLDPLFALTFDDGWSSDYTIAFPELVQRKFVGTFFIITSKVGTPGYVTWDQIKEMKKHGMEIGCHSHTHPERLTWLDEKQLTQEINESKKILDDKLGSPITTYSIPHGFYNGKVIEKIRLSGFDFICTSKPGTIHYPPRMNQLMKRNSFHREVIEEDISSILKPSQITKFVQGTNYLLRSVAKNTLSPQNYEKLKNFVTSRHD